MRELFHDGDPYHIETSPLIISANHWTSFYMIGTTVMTEIKTFHKLLQNFLVMFPKHKENCVKRVRVQSYSGPYFSRIFPHSDWIRRDTEYLSVCSPNVGKSAKNADQNNSKYGLFLHREYY